jgi:hypothetical protein
MTKYILIPHYSKSLTETQFWNRTLKNGKSVTLKVSNVYRCFQFEIELNDVEKAEMLKMDTIPLDNYSFTPDEMEGCDCWREILPLKNATSSPADLPDGVNETDFTEEEKAEIDEDNIDVDFLFDSDEWKSASDISYEIICGCSFAENETDPCLERRKRQYFNE